MCILIYLVKTLIKTEAELVVALFSRPLYICNNIRHNVTKIYDTLKNDSAYDYPCHQLDRGISRK